MKVKTRIVVGVIVVVATTAVAWALLGKREKAGPGFLTATVDRGAVIQNVTTTGTLTAVTTVKVGSQVSGIIATLHADFNDRVHRGQVLATLDPTPFEAAVNQTKAQLERARVAAQDAKAKLRRQQALYEAKLVSEDQLDSALAMQNQALAQVAELEAALERNQANLTYSIIRSPIDGVVVSRDYDVGQTVAASFQAPTLFTIAEDLTRMQLTCDVDEADIGQVKVDQPVRFSVDTFPEREFAGTVAQIRLSPKTANNVVTYPVIVEVDNGDLALLPGMTAEVRVQVARAEHALRVPASALRFRPELLGLSGQPRGPVGGLGGHPGGGVASRESYDPRRNTRVFLAPETPAGQLEPVTFTPGLTDGQFVEVKGGELAEGAKVVIGLATAQAQDAGGLLNMMGPRRR
ncbi:MAG: efflux RND transporter periplasmic adaptor subunit [Thermoanaerobaculaceae bacterium]|nr:efflux RND transporter periplasmic adaptor subunit [Thermoanaerobaculaceae bacterium]MDI9620269.1 efflux RND transporter periplasmic adaptor subunit [Acidobacteriota bacterium]NLH11225.1 efflux RND transporter periplasmic adaptor subunit [Holophagae bacterium]HPW56466.1 efflux RND transporter periplasmic adaptor subunit [Thermoanaerobaculaceae bacterium]